MKKTALILSVTAVVFSLFAAQAAQAASADAIDIDVKSTLEHFYDTVTEGKKLVQDAKGVLVFPAVFKAGIGIGAEYGEGALLVHNKTADYYSTAAASIGLQLGAQKKSIIVLFMQDGALKNFQASSGWKAGVDASVAVVAVGAGGALDSSKLNEPILGFIIGQKGLMYNLTLEGAKFTKIKK